MNVNGCMCVQQTGSLKASMAEVGTPGSVYTPQQRGRYSQTFIIMF